MIIRAHNILFYLAIAIVACIPTSVFAAWNTQQVQSPSIGLDMSIFKLPVLFLVINYALSIIGFWNILKFITFGILFFISAGDEETAKSAKGSVIHAVIGIIVVLFGYIAVAAASSLLGIDSVAGRSL